MGIGKYILDMIGSWVEAHDSQDKGTPMPRLPDPIGFTLETTLGDGSRIMVDCAHQEGRSVPTVDMTIRLYQEDMEIDWFAVNGNYYSWYCGKSKRPTEEHRLNRRMLSEERYAADFKRYDVLTRSTTDVRRAMVCNGMKFTGDHETDHAAGSEMVTDTVVDYVSLIADQYRVEIAHFLASQLETEYLRLTDNNIEIDARSIDAAINECFVSGFMGFMNDFLGFSVHPDVLDKQMQRKR